MCMWEVGCDIRVASLSHIDVFFAGGGRGCGVHFGVAGVLIAGSRFWFVSN